MRLAFKCSVQSGRFQWIIRVCVCVSVYDPVPIVLLDYMDNTLSFVFG